MPEDLDEMESSKCGGGGGGGVITSDKGQTELLNVQVLIYRLNFRHC